MKVLFFLVLMIQFQAYGQIDHIKTCAGDTPTEFVDECLFPNDDQKIVTCCDTKGAVFCGPSQCICAKGAAKIERLQVDAIRNLCESKAAQEHHYKIREARELAAAKAQRK